MSYDKNQSVILDMNDITYEFANQQHFNRAMVMYDAGKSTIGLLQMSQRVYDKKGQKFIKERHVGEELANELLKFARGDFSVTL